MQCVGSYLLTPLQWRTWYSVGGGRFSVLKAFPAFSACGNLPGKNSGAEHSHGFAMKHARHNFFVQIPAGIATLPRLTAKIGSLSLCSQYLLSLPSNPAVAGNARSAELTAEALTSYSLPSGEAAQLSCKPQD
ncbi:hypothetical protein C0T31_03015 [Dysgonamonadaceae bacterium]|nr:hypothetical protein C0T31_03015 [Dysgonamonadaceae bacterium]